MSEPTATPTRDASPLRFGILGAGNIAGQFAADMATAQRSVVTAVGSRSGDTADAFASKHGVGTVHGGYEALLRDDTVDAVYLTLPNALHPEWTVRALEAGKHVLCEKPLAMNAEQADAMFDAAKANGRTLVEGYMYRTHPLTSAVCAAVRSGVIGELRLIRASFCYATSRVDGNIRFDPALGGGALMDIGGYCTSYARLLAGCEPESFEVVGHLHERDVDDYAAGVLRFDGGRVVATFTCGMTAQADNVLHLGGTEGFIDLPVPWKPPVKDAAFVVRGQTPPKMDQKRSGNGGPAEARRITVDAPSALYAMEADAFADVVAGKREPFVTREDSVAQAELQRAMRQRLGLGY